MTGAFRWICHLCIKTPRIGVMARMSSLSEAHSTTWNYQKHFIQVPVKSVRLSMNPGSSGPYWQGQPLWSRAVRRFGTLGADDAITVYHRIESRKTEILFESVQAWFQYSNNLLQLLVVGVVDHVIEGSRARSTSSYFHLQGQPFDARRIITMNS